MPDDHALHIRRCLDAIDRPLDFCATTVVPAILPGLSIAGIGTLGLPLEAQQAAAISAAGEPAPYGRGTATVLDPQVRRVTMFTPERFRIDNPTWPAWLDDTVDGLGRQLGLPKRSLVAHLHQLLLYQDGDFFLPHRDGEKLPGMVATLAVVLPSQFTGGDVVVRHAGQECRLGFAAPEHRFSIQAAAWYADCEHAIEPLTSGARLVLIYNLTLTREKRPPAAPNFQAEIDRLRARLTAWVEDDGTTPRRLIVPLAHAYSADGLTPDLLKGVDAARAQALFAAASSSGLRAYLALVSCRETGEPLDYDDDDVGVKNMKMGEVYDEECTVDHWIDANGTPLALGWIPVESDDVLGGLAALKTKVSEQEFEGYTGNAGMELTHWYHRAAVVLWPDAHHAALLCRHGRRAALLGLDQEILRLRQNPSDTGQRAAAMAFAQHLLAAWPPERGGNAAATPGIMGVALAALGDAALIRTYFATILPRHPSEDPGPALPALAAAIGWPALCPGLDDWLATTNGRRLARDTRCLAVIARLAAVADDRTRSTITALSGRFAALVPAPGGTPDGHINAEASDAADDEQFPATLHHRAGAAGPEQAIVDLIAVAHALAAAEVLATLRAPLDVAGWDPVDHLAPALLAALKQEAQRCWPPLRSWAADCRQALARISAQPPVPPADHRRDPVASCVCGPCKNLSNFLRDPHTSTLRYPAAEPLRRHLTDIISRDQLELDVSIERRGRPYSLICTKTQAKYEQRLRRHQHILALVEQLL